MWKKRILCLALVLCAMLVMTACQKKETFPTSRQEAQQQATAEQPTAEPQDQQNIFGDTPEPESVDDWDYDPSSEAGGGDENIFTQDGAARGDEPTAVPIVQSEYAGATPVLIDPVDKPTPTPLPPLTFTYAAYDVPALHLSFEGPAGWMVDDSQPDAYTLTNPDPSMDYAAKLTIRVTPVSKNYNKNDLTEEVKGTLKTLSSSGFQKFERSNTAVRSFMNENGVYANYTGTTTDGAKIAGRLIIACSNKTLYILNVSYPQGYTKTYVENVYDKFRHTVKVTTAAATSTTPPN